MENQKKIPFFFILFLSLLFAFAYSQSPLFRSNQNTYFVHGLANANIEFLKSDWFVNTIDPFPAFSALVKITLKYIHLSAFYVEYIFLISLYIFSISGIVSKSTDIGNKLSKYIMYFLGITILHSASLHFLSRRIPHGEMIRLLHQGFADQYILKPFFQPCAFGVFLILSIYIFLKNKSFIAIIYLALAATFHPSYLLSGAVLTISYMYVLYQEKQVVRSLQIGIVALIMVLPVLLYVLINFSPTSPELLKESQHILANIRIPHHAKPSIWFSKGVVLQFIIIIAALIQVRKLKIFPLLFIPFIFGIILSLIQIITESNALALLFPWRVTVVLVPISTGLIVGKIISVLFKTAPGFLNKYARIINGAAVSMIFLLAVFGVIIFSVRYDRKFKEKEIPVMTFIKNSANEDHKYLIPVNMEKFRLFTGVPVFVDDKSHPYKDNEVIEWFQRIQVAKQFFKTKNIDIQNKFLETLRTKYKITHVVTDENNLAIENPSLNMIYDDNKFKIYEISI